MVSKSELYDQYIGAQMRLQAARMWRRRMAAGRFAQASPKNCDTGETLPKSRSVAAAGLDEHR
jgi:hypothetical protein